MLAPCPSCGKDQEIEYDRADGRNTLRCSVCKNPVDDEAGETQAGGHSRPAAPRAAPVAPTPLYSSIVITDDSATFRQLLKAAFLRFKLSEDIIDTPDGERFVEVVASRLSQRQGVGLVVLDLGMPLLGGRAAAVVLRSLERVFQAPAKAPILFFSGRDCDDEVRETMAHCAPAGFLNKGEGFGSIDDILRRVKQVLGSLPKG